MLYHIFKITFTPSEDSGQPVQMHSLIRLFMSGASNFKGAFSLPNIFYNKKCTLYIIHQITAHKCHMEKINIYLSNVDDNVDNTYNKIN